MAVVAAAAKASGTLYLSKCFALPRAALDFRASLLCITHALVRRRVSARDFDAARKSRLRELGS